MCFDLRFDIGYMMGAQKINFSEADPMGEMMQRIVNKGFKLWCEGIDSRKLCNPGVIYVASDDEEDDGDIKHKGKKSKKSSLEERNVKIADMGDRLKQKHGYQYNMIQYKFWAETLQNKQHQSWDTPPAEFIWGKPKEPKQN